MSQRPQRVDWYCVSAIVGAAVILLVTLLLPLGFDNDVYQSMAWALYAYHGLPYLASWDMNFPGIVFIHWASIALFGSSDFGFRLFDYLVQIVFAAMYFRLLRRWLSPFESLVAVVVYAVGYVHGAWGIEGQRDAFAVFFLVASALVLFRMRERVPGGWSAVTLGVLSSAAILIRPTYGLFAIVLAALVWSLNTRWQHVLSYLFGHVMLWTFFLVPYALTDGGISQFYHSTISFNLDIYSRIRVGNGVFSMSNLVYWILALLGLVLPARCPTRYEKRNIERFDRKFMVLFAMCAIISPMVMGKYFTYHLLAAQTILIPLACVGLLKTLDYVPWRNARHVAIAASLVVPLGLLYPRHLIRYYASGLHSGEPLHYTYAKVLSDSLFGLAAQEEAVRYLDARIGGSAKVEYVTLFPALSWRLGHPTATRFTTIVPLARASEAPPLYVKVWQKEFIDSIQSAKPSYVILSRSHEWWPFVHAYADSVAHQIPGFDEMLATRYQLDTVIRGFELYRLRP